MGVIIRGALLRGVGNDVINLLDTPGAYALIKPGEKTTYSQGVLIEYIESVIEVPYVKLEKSNTNSQNYTVYRNGRPFVHCSKNTSTLIDYAGANWNFLHKGDESYSIFMAFNPDPIPSGTTNASLKSLLGTKLGSSTNAGFSMRLWNDPAKPNKIQVSRNATLDFETPANAFVPGQVNVMEFRFTKTGTQNKMEMWVNKVSMGMTTTTTVDKTGDVPYLILSSALASDTRFLGYFGEIFIVKNTGKTAQQVLDESVIINTYFNKYPLPTL